MVFYFPTDDALLFALTGGLVPATVSLAPARAGRERPTSAYPAGRPWLAPAESVPAAVPAALRRAGVETSDDAPAGRDVDHWLEAVLLRRDPLPAALTGQAPVLFEVAGPAALRPLVGEM